MATLKRGEEINGWKVQSLIKQNLYTETYRAEDADGNTIDIPLIRYVYDDLTADGIYLQTPLYRKMLSESVAHTDDAQFTASRYFMNNADIAVSQEAVNLMTERYQLSKDQKMASEQELMPEYITHLLLDYKFLVIDEELKACQAQMNDPLLCADAMKQYIELSQIQRELAKRLGDRILIK